MPFDSFSITIIRGPLAILRELLLSFTSFLKYLIAIQLSRENPSCLFKPCKEKGWILSQIHHFKTEWPLEYILMMPPHFTHEKKHVWCAQDKIWYAQQSLKSVFSEWMKFRESRFLPDHGNKSVAKQKWEWGVWWLQYIGPQGGEHEWSNFTCLHNFLNPKLSLFIKMNYTYWNNLKKILVYLKIYHKHFKTSLPKAKDSLLKSSLFL